MMLSYTGWLIQFLDHNLPRQNRIHCQISLNRGFSQILRLLLMRIELLLLLIYSLTQSTVVLKAKL